MAPRLKGRIAVVTGSDSGIGQATAVEFAQEGADVVVTWLHDRDGAEETRRRVEAAGRHCLVRQLDHTSEPDVEALFAEAERTLGAPFILVNNAGIPNIGREVVDLDAQGWDHVIRTDLYGPFFAARHFARLRRRVGGGGRILNVTSVHQEIAVPSGAGYTAAKGALRNLTRVLALELAPDRINVNNIAPGMVLTPMNQEAIDDPRRREEQVRHIPWKRAAEPWEVARLAVYLASDDADYVTGQSFFIDGGLTLNVGQGA